MSTGDNTNSAPSDKLTLEQNQQPTENAWTRVAQDVNAPGSKIDKSNADLAAFNAGNTLPSLEITSVQANNDQLPGTGNHTDSVQMTENGKQINATYNPDTHQLTYQRTDAKSPETVTVDMLTGKETTVIGSAPESKGDGTTSGDITVVRNQAGGEVISFEQNVNGKNVSLLGPDGKPLPGLSTDGNDLHNHAPDVQVDAEGQVKNYNTEAGVKVTLGDDGKPSSYSSNGFTFERHDDGWYYHQDSGGDYVKIDEPTVASDGTIHAKENGLFNDGREHSLDEQGENTGRKAVDHSDDPTNIVKDDNPQTLDEVLETMRKLNEALPDNDGLKYFNQLYTKITEGVKEGIEKGMFKDPAYTAQLDVNFANLYLDAIKANLNGEPMPEAWQALFDARNQNGIEPIQFAMAGINAHINHDLAYALVQSNKDFGIQPGDDSPQHDDFETINDILQQSMDESVKLLDKGTLGHLANSSGETGQTISLEGIKAARELAWETSQQLDDGGIKASIIAEIQDQVSGALGTTVLAA